MHLGGDVRAIIIIDDGIAWILHSFPRLRPTLEFVMPPESIPYPRPKAELNSDVQQAQNRQYARRLPRPRLRPTLEFVMQVEKMNLLKTPESIPYPRPKAELNSDVRQAQNRQYARRLSRKRIG
jgi:hypothetical protein